MNDVIADKIARALESIAGALSDIGCLMWAIILILMSMCSRMPLG